MLSFSNAQKNGNEELLVQAGIYLLWQKKYEKANKDFGLNAKIYTDYKALCADETIDIIHVCTPNPLHKEMAILAMESGKHVYCEKPLALNEEEARLMYDTAKENGVILMEAYAYLHSPYVESLKNDVKSGIIGEVDYIDTSFVTQGYKEDFRLHKELGGGAFYDLGCYCTTMILSLIDSDPEMVKAVAEFSDLGVDLSTSAILRFKNGARAALQVGMILDMTSNSRYDRLLIHGSKGSIRSDVEYNQEGDVSYRIYTKDGEVTERSVFVPNNYKLEVEQLGRCIRDGEMPHVCPEFSLKNTRLMDQVLNEIGFWK